MANQNSTQDDNRFPALTVHSGTAGTAETIKATSSVTPGALDVAVVSGSFGDLTIGNIGTVGTVPGVGVLGLGTVVGKTAAGAPATTNPVLIAGTNGGGSVMTMLTGDDGRVEITNLQIENNTSGAASSLSNIDSYWVSMGAPFGAMPVAVNSLPDPLGSVVVTAGTVDTSVVFPDPLGSVVVTQGTIASVGTVPGVGVVTSVSNLVKGTVTKLEGGTVQVNVETGTIQSSGTTTGVGTVTNVGQIHNAGTIQAVNSIVAGTQNTLGTVGVINNIVKGTVTKLEGGTVQTNIETGTVTSVSNLAAGTITALAAGTITAGTIRQQWQPVNQILTHGTLGTAGGSFFGTLSAASGVGTKHMISGVSVVMDSGTADVRILVGTAIQGAGVLAAGKFVPSAGIVRDFNPPIETATNTELTYHFVGAGTAFITVQYWKSLI